MVGFKRIAISIVMLFMLVMQARAELHLSIVVPDGRYVVGEMIPVTLRGEYNEPITLEKLEFPNSGAYDWMQLERDQWREERIKGKLFKVFERKIAVFAKNPGALEIGPVTHQLTIAVAGGRETRNVVADKFATNIAPFPGKTGRLAAKELKITDKLSANPGTLKDGELLVRTVTLEALGTMAHLVPSRPKMRQFWLVTIPGLEERETLPTSEGPITRIKWEWSFHPMTGEPGVLPEVSFDWFDTTQRKVRASTLAAIPIAYSSFSKNISGAANLGKYQILLASMIIFAGFLFGLFFIRFDQSLASAQTIATRIKRYLPDPTFAGMKKAVSRGDLVALRSAFLQYQERCEELGRPLPQNPLKKLDEVLYGPKGDHIEFNGEEFLEQFVH